MAGRNDRAIADALQALAQAIGNPNKEEDGGAVEYQVSYPNFVRGPLLDDMRPFFGPCEVLGTHH